MELKNHNSRFKNNTKYLKNEVTQDKYNDEGDNDE